MILKGVTRGPGLFALLSQGLRLLHPTGLCIGGGHLGGDFRNLVGKAVSAAMASPKAPGKIGDLRKDLSIGEIGPREQVA